MMLSYYGICVHAAIADSTVSTYVAQTYPGRGRAAWTYLNDKFGLKSLTQQELRNAVIKLKFTEQDDPRLFVMVYDRVCGRINPPLPQSEKVQMLLDKIPSAYNDIVTTIEAKIEIDNYDRDKNGARHMFEHLITKRQARSTHSTDEHSTDMLTRTRGDDCGTIVNDVHGPSETSSCEERRAANNKRNRAVLASRFPGYCAHELYFHHLRGSARRCTNKIESEQPECCRRGRHDRPPDFGPKTRDIEW